MMTALPLIVVIGPTAVGKSSLAVKLAEAFIGKGQASEIINADSMAVYRGMDIGTAKPSQAERERVPHHLIDILDVTQTASVAEFQAMARETIRDLRQREVLPILVGGSSLYVRAILDDFDFPGTDSKIRAKWEARLEQVGAYALHEELAAIAPEAARAILPGNGRRIVRALEVLELTGSIAPRLPQPAYALEAVYQFGLQIDRTTMDERIVKRVDQMWAEGLIEEVKMLATRGLREGLTASRALGYHQVLAYLDGQINELEAKQATIDKTRRFARKQLGWFRRDPRIVWIEWDDPGAVERIMDAVGDN